MNDNRKSKCNYTFRDGKASSLLKTDAHNLPIKCNIPFNAPVSLSEFEEIENK